MGVYLAYINRYINIIIYNRIGDGLDGLYGLLLFSINNKNI